MIEKSKDYLSRSHLKSLSLSLSRGAITNYFCCLVKESLYNTRSEISLAISTRERKRNNNISKQLELVLY